MSGLRAELRLRPRRLRPTSLKGLPTLWVGPFPTSPRGDGAAIRGQSVDGEALPVDGGDMKVEATALVRMAVAMTSKEAHGRRLLSLCDGGGRGALWS